MRMASINAVDAGQIASVRAAHPGAFGRWADGR
jgi:hypothetical protein